MTAYVLVIVLAARGHHQPFAVGYPDQGSCLVAAERLRRNKKVHVECYGRELFESTQDRKGPLRVSGWPNFRRSLLAICPTPEMKPSHRHKAGKQGTS